MAPRFPVRVTFGATPEEFGSDLLELSYFACHHFGREACFEDPASLFTHLLPRAG